MFERKETGLSKLALILAFSTVIIYFGLLQFDSPTLYGADGYYHLAVSDFIRDFGVDYEFRWTQFSTFKNAYSDSDFLFHLLIIPFLYLSDNIVLAGKYAIIFYNTLFFIAFVIILKKYLPNFLVAGFLLFPLFSVTFSTYFLYLRGITLGGIFTILAIYFLIEKKWIKLAILSLLYPLTHLSFFTIIVFSLLCEIVRYLYSKEFFLRNIYVVILASILGCLIHPNYPNNLVALHLNIFLMPAYLYKNLILNPAGELHSFSFQRIFIFNFSVFITLGFVFWMGLLARVKASLSTLVWWACTSIYLLFSFRIYRYWYTANILIFIFFASYLRDWLNSDKRKLVSQKAITFIIIFLVILLPSFFLNFKSINKHIGFWSLNNRHHEKVALWMKSNIPAGQTIYHAPWGTAAYFIGLNPKNNYIVACDPIYMAYPYPEEYKIYDRLNKGKISEPHKILGELFKTRYGYVRKNKGLYGQVKKDRKNFQVLYEDNIGIIFKLKSQAKP